MARKKYTKAEIRRALRKVRTKLLNGTITKEQFDMDTILFVEGCGTIGCIGGHMAAELSPGLSRRYRTTVPAHRIMCLAADAMPNLRKLFFDYPNSWWGNSRITRRRAAFAITRALAGAEDPWRTRARR